MSRGTNVVPYPAVAGCPAVEECTGFSIRSYRKIVISPVAVQVRQTNCSPVTPDPGRAGGIVVTTNVSMRLYRSIVIIDDEIIDLSLLSVP